MALNQADHDDWLLQEKPDDPEHLPVVVLSGEIADDGAGGWGHHALAYPVQYNDQGLPSGLPDAADVAPDEPAHVYTPPSEAGPSSSNADDRFEAGGDSTKAAKLQPCPVWCGVDHNPMDEDRDQPWIDNPNWEEEPWMSFTSYWTPNPDHPDPTQRRFGRYLGSSYGPGH